MMTHPGRAVDLQSASSCVACVDCIAWLLVHSEVVIVKQKNVKSEKEFLRKKRKFFFKKTKQIELKVKKFEKIRMRSGSCAA